MDLAITDEQTAMAELVRDLVDDWQRRPPSSEGRWRMATEAGLDSALISVEDGGLGLGVVDVIHAFRALGPVAGDWPWAATLVVGPLLGPPLGLPNGPHGAAVLHDSGKVRARHVTRFNHVIVLASTGAAVVGAASWTASSGQDLLGERGWAYGPIDPQIVTLPDAGRVLAAARVVEASVLLGVADRALSLAVDHAKARRQFDRSIGAFQAVKHLLAEARTELSFVEPLVLGAACAVDARTPDLGRDAAAALLAAAEAARRTVRASIQVHGAIGYTQELPLGNLLNAVHIGLDAWGGHAALAQLVDKSLLAGSESLGTPFGLPWEPVHESEEVQ